MASRGPRDPFLALASSSDALVCVCRPSAAVVYVSPAFERATGLAVGDFVGGDAALFAIPEDRPALLAAIATEAAADDASPPLVVRVRAAAGGVSPAGVRVRAIEWEGTPARLLVATPVGGPPRESPDGFRQLVEAADDGILLLAADAHILYANRSTQQRVGPRDLGRARLPELFAPADRGSAERALVSLDTGAPTASFLAELAGGASVDVKLARLHDAPSGATTLAVVRDVTAQRRVQDRHRRDARRLSLAISATADAIWEWDLVSNTTYYSPRWYEMLGYADQQFEMSFEAWKALCHPDDFQPTLDAVQSLLTPERKPGYSAEFRMRAADGTWRWILARGNVVERDDEGRPVLLSGTNTDVTARKHAEEALADSERRLRVLADNVPTAMLYQLVRSPEGARRLSYVSGGVERAHGLTAEEAYADVGRLYGQIHPDDRARVDAAEEESRRTGSMFVVEARLIHPQRGLRWALFRSAPRRAPDGSVIWDGVELDITEIKEAEAAREHLEQSLRQAQKMETVGRLAGGIAHDFNNLLTAIKANVSLALRAGGSPSQVREWLEGASAGTDAAARLTRQLLAFSRKQVIAPKNLDVNGLIAELLKMIGRLLGEDVALVTDLAQELGTIRADPGQLEQILVNLVINARDAMPHGGTLTLRTANVRRETDAGTFGDFVCITVEDTGEGMSPEVMANIFEPFYTTKAPGLGTGLGLAMVYGAVTQNGGYVEARSAPGAGATFRVSLPWSRDLGARRETVDAAATPSSSAAGGETLVLVEDDDGVRIVAEQVLRLEGYRVLSFRDGESALAALATEAAGLDALITDVRMPGMTGREIATRLRAARPGLRVLYTSGYPSEVIAHHGVLEEGIQFLEKPYSPEILVARVRRVLDD